MSGQVKTKFEVYSLLSTPMNSTDSHINFPGQRDTAIAPVICNHCSPTYGEGWGIMTFQFQCLAISPTPMRRQTGGQNFAICPTLCNRKFPWGKDPNVKTLSFPLHYGDTPKLPRTVAQLSPILTRRWGWVGGGGGAQWLQMTGA